MVTTAERAHPAVAWALSDGRAGNVRQATALAGALAIGAMAEVTLAARAPWSWVAPRRLPGAAQAFGAPFAASLAAPPLVAVGCGRQAALATRLLRARGARAVQVLHPRIDPRHWDLVIAPAHDGLRGGNVITTLGSLHPVDDAWLARARAAFNHFAELPSPRTTLLLGGPSAHAGFDLAALHALLARIDAVAAREGGSLLVTASRRTPPALRDALRAHRGRVPLMAWVDDTDGRNPYPGMLAWADRIVCTADSVNMLSEACATAVPVFVAGAERMRGRPRRFVDELLARGRIRAVDERLDAYIAIPLRETARIACEVRARLGLA
ncbi:mitochondrial fission ELM1 family protein [Luteimonas sp. MC1782]|uniref:mitochondrial fission ELM1 family protein n=1 Tax=Luteimonas sp. MC1782 TaxID=2760305 RepID=UPI001602E5DF|nr:mitochondrial fission ELM1 family protein [Luteimonas sp. MC1782]MBB1473635.1 mitochondrial fission ELM1 family protein [Luteimonas sp. MC1782]